MGKIELDIRELGIYAENKRDYMSEYREFQEIIPYTPGSAQGCGKYGGNCSGCSSCSSCSCRGCGACGDVDRC